MSLFRRRRAVCHYCEQTVRLNRKGKIRPHSQMHVHGKQDMWRVCYGSDRRPWGRFVL